jgi:vitellogenic carboxypeptidase-like protein
MRSVRPQVESLLRRTRVLLYQGVRDLRDGVVSTEAWLGRPARVPGRPARRVADRGRGARGVRAAVGRLVPADNGRAAQEMIEGWVLGTGMFGSGSRGGGNGRRRAA